MTTVQRKHVVEGAFAETTDGARLLGSRCAGCGTCFFPRSAACRNPGCSDKRSENVELSPRGKLWSYTVQYYKPPPPARLDEPFTPYGIGLVDLPEGIRIMGMISSDKPEALKIGHEMELVIETLYHDDDGVEVVTWKFRPLERAR
jgi:uncharacterized OB-fold protein